MTSSRAPHPPLDVDALRERNQEKAEREAADGPIEQDAARSSLADAISSFHERDALVFAVPAHRSGRGGVEPDAAAWTGGQAFRADVNMDKSLDTRHQSWQVEPTAMELFAEAVGADQTLFSTGGSSQNVRVALMTVAKPGDKVIVARNAHKSVFAGLVLAGVQPVYVDPAYHPELQIAHGIEPAELGRVLDAHSDAAAVLVATPTYYGVSADVAALAEITHGAGIPLITDDAWGLDYSFCSRLPKSALECGADIAIGSVHKSLNAFSQTSVLSVQGDRIDTARLELVFELEQSTSASSLLLSSIDGARRQFERDGEALLGSAVDLAERLRAGIRAIDGLRLAETDDLLRAPGVFDFDPTHVSFDVTPLGLTGFAAADWLREHRSIHLELHDHRRLMALVTYADTEDRVDRLLEGLRALAQDHADADHGEIPQVPRDLAPLRMETVMSPRDAFLGTTELVPWREAAGRISAEMVCPYPPGVPIVAPGERLTAPVVEYLEQVSAAGGMLEGAVDESLSQLRVVAS